jgi:hypothetical protein
MRSALINPSLPSSLRDCFFGQPVGVGTETVPAFLPRGSLSAAVCVSYSSPSPCACKVVSDVAFALRVLSFFLHAYAVSVLSAAAVLAVLFLLLWRYCRGC